MVRAVARCLLVAAVVTAGGVAPFAHVHATGHGHDVGQGVPHWHPGAPTTHRHRADPIVAASQTPRPVALAWQATACDAYEVDPAGAYSGIGAPDVPPVSGWHLVAAIDETRPPPSPPTGLRPRAPPV